MIRFVGAVLGMIRFVGAVLGFRALIEERNTHNLDPVGAPTNATHERAFSEVAQYFKKKSHTDFT